jgi:nitroreductase
VDRGLRPFGLEIPGPGYRYFYLDAGHMAAHLSLAAVAQGLSSCPIAAFYDDEVNAYWESTAKPKESSI